MFGGGSKGFFCFYADCFLFKEVRVLKPGLYRLMCCKVILREFFTMFL